MGIHKKYGILWILVTALASTLALNGCFEQSISVPSTAGITPPSSHGSQQGLPRLTLSGSSILDPNGKPIMLRGFNWGNWGLAQPQDAQDHVAQGANVVRILLRWWGQYSDPAIDARDDQAPGHIKPANLARVQQEVAWATSQGLWVDLVIDSNCGQSAVQDTSMQAYCDPQNQYGSAGHNFWTDPAMRAEFFEVWQYVANQFKNTPYIAMYEPLPEPNPPGVAQSDVTEFYKEAIRAIKQVDTSAPFLIGATSAYNIRNSEQAYIPDAEFANQLIYTGDLFVFTTQDQATNIANLSTRLQGLLSTRDDHDVPIFVQQTGVKTGDDPTYVYLNSVLSLLNDNSVPWTMWDYRDGSNSASSFGVYYRDTNGNWIEKPDTLNAVKSHF